MKQYLLTLILFSLLITSNAQTDHDPINKVLVEYSYAPTDVGNSINYALSNQFNDIKTWTPRGHNSILLGYARSTANYYLFSLKIGAGAGYSHGGIGPIYTLNGVLIEHEASYIKQREMAFELTGGRTFFNDHKINLELTAGPALTHSHIRYDLGTYARVVSSAQGFEIKEGESMTLTDTHLGILLSAKAVYNLPWEHWDVGLRIAQYLSPDYPRFSTRMSIGYAF